MGVIADWTTAGPYHNLSWLTIVFTIGVILTLILTIIELHDAWSTFGTVKNNTTNEGIEVLAKSTLLRSLARFGVQLAFLILSSAAVFISIRQNHSDLYWYRIIFVVSFLSVETLLCLSAVNDIVARHKLEVIIDKYYNRSDLDEQ